VRSGQKETLVTSAALVMFEAGVVEDLGRVQRWTRSVSPDLIGTCVPAGEGLSGRVLATGQPVLLDEEHPLDGADTLRDACDTPIWIAVPITAQGKVQGALSLAVDPPRHCSPQDTAVLMLFARFCAAGLRMHPLLERARQAAAMSRPACAVSRRTACRCSDVAPVPAGEEGQRDQLAGVETAAGDVQRQHGAARVRSLVEEVPDDLVTCPLRLLPSWPMQKSLT
jgi:GAF domain